MKESEILYCPYCGSENIEFQGDNDYWNGTPWHCYDCESWFNKDDVLYQGLRHKISAYLIDANENNPLELCAGPKDPDKIFQVPGDGSIWYHLPGELDDSDPTGLYWHDLDELDTIGLVCVLECIEKNF